MVAIMTWLIVAKYLRFKGPRMSFVVITIMFLLMHDLSPAL